MPARPRIETVLPPLLPLLHLLRVVAYAEVLEQREPEVLDEVPLALALVEFAQFLVVAVLGVQIASPACRNAALAGRGAYVELAGLGVREAVGLRHACQCVVVRGHDFALEYAVELRTGQMHTDLTAERLATVGRRQDLRDCRFIQSTTNAPC